MAALAHPAGALVVINDRVDVALAAGIRAVHVGQDDVPAAMVRRFLGPEGIIGLSTHTRAQVDAALYEPIDYLAVGPIFDTTSKDPGYDAVGLELIAYAASKTELPIVAIGGITLERARRVLDAGARSVAVIGDLLRTGDPAARVREFLQALQPAGLTDDAGRRRSVVSDGGARRPITRRGPSGELPLQHAVAACRSRSRSRSR